MRLRRRSNSGPTAERAPERAVAVLDPDAALAAAEEQFADGRFGEAIAVLTEANRARRDPRLERRLVDMRFDAFRLTDWSDERVTLPEVDDRFPGAGIPEIARADLDAETVRSAVTHHGSLLVRGLASADRAAQLRDSIDDALAAYDRWFAGAKPVDVGPSFVPFKGEPRKVERKFRRDVGGVLAVDSPPGLFDVIEAFEDAGVGRMIEGFLGERPVLLAKKWTLRRVPHDSGRSDWHQDGSFMGGDIRSLNVWLSLSHCGDDAPGLDVVARRLEEIVPTGTDGAFLNWTVGPHLVDRLAAGCIERPIFEAGDALIFDHMNLHRTAVTPAMTQDRYAIEAWFLAPSTYASMTLPVEEGRPPNDQLPMLY